MRRTLRLVLLAGVSLVLALLVALVGTTAILHEPRSTITQFITSLLLSGAAALGFGLLIVLVGLPALPRLVLQIGVGYLVGSVTAIITIVAMAPILFAQPHAHELLILFLICFLAVSLGLASIVSSSVTRYLAGLTRAAQRVAHGELGAQVDVPTRDELFQLATAFNHMSVQLEQAFTRVRSMEEGRRQLVAAISHDLHTPLTSIRLMVEAMRDGVASDAVTTRGYLDRMYHDVHHLSRLIDDLFELSQLESGNPELVLEVVNMHELVSDTVDSIYPLAQQKGVTLEIDIEDDTSSLRADPAQFQRVIANLVQNAVQHSSAGGTARVTAHANDHETGIEITDTGEGISSDDLPHVFDAFYRADTARAHEDHGFGLGLTIAKAIVEAHGGSISLESALSQGSRVTIMLPTARE